MPPRIPGVQRLGTFSLCLRPALLKPSAGSSVSPSSLLLLLPVTQTASLSQKEKKRLAKQDPYRWAQMQQRKNAHLERRGQLEAQRAAGRGDPVRGITTPFVESFDSAGQAPLSTPPLDEDGNPLAEPHELPTSPHILNNLLHADELEDALLNAYTLRKPDNILAFSSSSGGGSVEGGAAAGGGGGDEEEVSIAAEAAARADPEKEQRRHEEHEAAHARAAEAVRRIVHLNAGSAKDRRHANIRRIVETFGRHSTDLTLRPRALSRGQLAAMAAEEAAKAVEATEATEAVEAIQTTETIQTTEAVEATETTEAAGVTKRPVRGGPDTGSSEVQIAILTAKIRALANQLETGRGYKDKVGKRDLRLLVHRRQRLLQYMERKERGSGRWKHLVETLGLTEATYKGQITL